MAVIGRCESGFLVDHKKSIAESVSPLLLTCKETLFALYEPYFRSSTENSCEPNGTRKRKRKKFAKVCRTEEESEAALQHHKVRDTIATGVERLVQIGVDKNHFLSGIEHAQQNNAISAVPEDRKDFAGLLADVSSYTKAELKHLLEPLVIKGENIAVIERDLLDRMISYPCNNPVVLNISGDEYILPANCSFLMSNASNLKPLINHAQHNGLYTLIVLDPPWFNKSAKRGSKYSFMSLWQIKSLPVPDLLAPGALVAIWVTNKQKYLRFTKTELFPHWSVELVAEWYWVKVTRKGELVTDLDSPHKKPYEPLLLGRFIAKKDSPGMSCLSVNKSNESAKVMLENKSNVLSPRKKRKKINECDEDDDEINTACYISDKNVVTTVSQELTSLSSLKTTTGLNCVAHSDHEDENLDNFFQTMPPQSPRKYCLSCSKPYHKNEVDLSDDKESSIDRMQSEHTEKEVMELYDNNYLCETATDFNFSVNAQDTKPIINNTSKHSDFSRGDGTSKDCKLLPYHQIICSIPCKIHSRKPSVNEILSQYIPRDSLCLEMFARNLTPHWTSWGNEVLRFQGMQYFEQLPPKEETDGNTT